MHLSPLLLEEIVTRLRTTRPSLMMMISAFLSSCHEIATEALCIGRIQTRLGAALVSDFSA